MATQNIVSYSKDMINNPGNIRKIVFNAGIESSLEYAEPQRNKAPKIQLLFSPFGLPFIPLEIVGSDVGKIISNFSWTKDRTNPGGICNITITPDSKLIQAFFLSLILHYSDVGVFDTAASKWLLKSASSFTLKPSFYSGQTKLLAPSFPTTALTASQLPTDGFIS